MPIINAKYIAERNGQEYSYEIRYETDGKNVTWDAKVRSDGDLRGTPSGQMLGLGGEQGLRRLLQKWVESCIEDRVGIE